MDDFVKIQGIFSDIYCKSFKNKLDEYNKMRIRRLVLFFAAIAVLLGFAMILFIPHLMIASKMPLYLIVLLPFIIAFFGDALSASLEKHFNKIDRIMKQDLMRVAGLELSPLIKLNWQKSKFTMEQFDTLFRYHRILKINKMFFKSDDCFSGEFHKVKFNIYEISNKYNFIELVYVFCSKFWLAFIWSAGIGIFPAFFLYGFTYQILSVNFQKYWLICCYVISVIGLLFLLARKNNTKGGLAVSFDVNLFDLFRGVVAEFTMSKNFKGHTLVFENSSENYFIKNILSNGYEKVNLEDIEFNRIFSVYTTDQIEARYVLTTRFMEKLKNLKQDFASKYIRASFKNGRLALAIQSDKDLFQVGSIWRKTDAKMYQTMFVELLSILKVPDTLALENTIL